MRKVFLTFLCLILAAAASRTDTNLILKKNVFTQPAPPKTPVRYSILKPQPAPALDTLVELKGIIYAPQVGSMAVLRLKNQNEESLFRQGEIVCAGAVIARIEEKRVVFEYEGKEVSLSLPETTLASSGTQPAAVTIEKGKEPATKTVVLPVSGREATTAPPVAQEPLAVSVSEVLNQLRDTPNLMENFKVSPFITEEGRVEGFRVSQVPENSLPYQYGLRSGDIIRRVNGVLIDSLARAFAVYQQVLNSATKTVTVEVIRNNTPLLLSYHLR